MKTRTYTAFGTGLMRAVLLTALVLAALVNPQAARAGGGGIRCYVNAAAAPGGSGLAWGSAYNDLQLALANVSCTEIWVAQGLYKPGNAAYSYFTFQINPGVQVYGGFGGTETLLSERNWATHVTILSGDVDGNDKNLDGNHIDETYTDIVGTNAYHVVNVDGATIGPVTSTTVLDGFTITGGAAGGPSWPYDSGGGGLFCLGSGATHGCSPTLSNLTFSGNAAAYGGGAIYNAGFSGGLSNPTLTQVIFNGNAAGNGGGAMYNDGNTGTSNPSLTYVWFGQNVAQYGGAVYNLGHSGNSNPVFTNVNFNGNGSTYDGGAVYNDGNAGTSSPTFTLATDFSGNTAGGSGGAVYNNGNGGGTSSPSFTDVSFNGNSSTSHGGAVYNFGYAGSSSPTFSRVTFNQNISGNVGGALYNDGRNSGNSSPSLTNVTLFGNSAYLAGGMYSNGDGGTSSPTLRNVTFSGNAAGYEIGALGSYASGGSASTSTLFNVILWGDTAFLDTPEAAGSGVAVMNISNSVVQGGCGSLAGASCGTGNQSTDPLLGALADNGGLNQTMALGLTSSAVDTGDDTVCAAGPVSSIDQRGIARPQGVHCDIGAFELRTFAISGSASIVGATLGYQAGLPFTATADGSGNYSFRVPENWSGTVTPFKLGYGFSPASRDYSGVMADQTNQYYNGLTPPAAGQYDDTSGNWSYSGAWAPVSVAGPYNGTLMIGATVGSEADFEFYGNGFSLQYLQYTNWGKIGVYLDGSATPLATIDTNGPTGLPTYVSPGLIPGPHILTLKNAGPAGSYIALDMLEIRQPSMVGAGALDDSSASWSYTGAWVPLSVSGPYNNSLMIGATTGSTTTLFFHGSGFSLTYLQYTGWGNIAIYLDGNPVALTTINTNGSTSLPTYTSPPLTTSDHVLRLVHAGPAGKFIAIDELVVAP